MAERPLRPQHAPGRPEQQRQQGQHAEGHPEHDDLVRRQIGPERLDHREGRREGEAGEQRQRDAVGDGLPVRRRRRDASGDGKRHAGGVARLAISTGLTTVTQNASNEKERPMADPVLLSQEGAVAVITLNRPEVLNALSMEMAQQLCQICWAVEADRSVRAVLVKGAGKGFQAGGDIASFHREMDRDRGACRQHDRHLSRRGPHARAHAEAGRRPASRRRRRRGHEPRHEPRPRRRGGRNGVHAGLRQSGHEPRRRLDLLSCRAWSAGAGRWRSPSSPIGSTRRARSTSAWSTGSSRPTSSRRRRWRSRPSSPPGRPSPTPRTKALIDQSFENDLATQLEAERVNFVASTGTDDFKEGVAAFVGKRRPDFKGA